VINQRDLANGSSECNGQANDWQQQDLEMSAEFEGIALNNTSPDQAVQDQAGQISQLAISAGVATDVIPQVLQALWNSTDSTALDELQNNPAFDQQSVIDAAQQSGPDLQVASGRQISQLPCVSFGSRWYAGYHRLDLLEVHTLASISG